MHIIGMAGGSGSGKTTFAHKVLRHVPVNTAILHMDSYYLPGDQIKARTKSGHINYDHPAAFDWDLLLEHLSAIKLGHSIDIPVYDFRTSSRTEAKAVVGPAKVVILEGIMTLFDHRVREKLDITCFLHVESDIRFIRRLHRDVRERGRSLESVIEQYYETVRPMYQKYLDPQRQFADFIVGEETDVAASILAARVKELLISESEQSMETLQ